MPMVLLELDQFLSELTVMFEHSSEKGSVWVTVKSSSLTSKVKRNKKLTSGEPVEYKCLVRATDGKKIISTTVGERDQEHFQASYAAILHAHMTALKEWGNKEGGNKMDAEPKKF